ncbi:thiamine phosphate synthase [Robiginitomaculum antarcticum]|uniref:thiamine phosphate synthase n=1 Tax=Robiginitomaculum antarcticum TaxID=437507 RepID=UPI00037DAEF0|nr:thiamine phosphate synthase [Robiginitomaculum antarcticum]
MSKRKSKSQAHIPSPPQPCQIYLLTPPRIEDLDAYLSTLDAALSAASVACLQIRFKEDDSHKDWNSSARIQAARAIVELAQGYGTAVLINDDVKMAKDLGADGVHIGQEDMPYAEARDYLGPDAIIGVTCHDSRDLGFEAAMDGADYVAFGAFFDTPTKTPKTRAQLEILSWWQEMVEVPCVAIGGITPGNAAQVIAAGADFIAVSSGVWAHPDGAAAAVSKLSALCQLSDS